MAESSFNSNMVRLNQAKATELGYVIFCFNSNMVRLNLRHTDDEMTERKAFQFQYGAIKSLYETFIHTYPTFVSIPIWCD